MSLERPDLSGVDDGVRAYIEALEAELLQLKSAAPSTTRRVAPATLEPSEPPTTMQVITMTADGMIKRTARHHYIRQRRAGMGVFEIDTPEDFPATLVAVADEGEDLIAVTNEGRLFRIATATIPEGEVRSKGGPLDEVLASLLDGETVVALLPADKGLYVAMVSERGWVRRVRNTYLGKRMIPGIRYHKVSQGGYITGACWTDGNGDVFLGTKLGKGIRFSEAQIPGSGCLGLRVDQGDVATMVAGTHDGGGLFVLGQEGKGSIRLMAGFRKNKAPGAGGKVVLKTERLIGAVPIEAGEEVFAISKLSKMIRFMGDEVPPKEGVVQGVNCMALRSDAVVAFAVSPVVEDSAESNPPTDDTD